MKIPLNMSGDGAPGPGGQKVPESQILAAKGGDWSAKNELARVYLPLITSLAEKRTSDTAKLNTYIEAGRDGLAKAARKYKRSVGVDRFQIFALDFIEAAMDGVDNGPSGFFSRLFGK